LVLSALIIIAICMFLYVKNNPIEPFERVDGTFAIAEREIV